ncbi:protein CcdC [Paenibacillus baekrokdamisoli]|uniref:Protein CcdC n=1 Tax=Paenibacillus baekrokdamisoli TaxID=1712516 RepID=A0A3G9JFJ0_9BACL|nr:cytochrome c biogenesis protein CcdC [Paenibacillus baekrokdamisoli]MBB3068920.1 membrane protein CcdC involved in cytochrome C biogenesis [Paenibacillus baekrokdamisoli]BBH23743.1 protein CcdC [Paenibacillus baekrokdamisoli]
MNFLSDPGRLTHIGSIIITLLSGVAVLFLRMRASNKPTTMRKIIMPPIGMSTGFLMFIAPVTRVPWSWALTAFAVGALLFAYPLIRTSKLERIGDTIVLKRSKMFIFILLALLLARLLLHDVVEQSVTIPQTGGLFFILAFGMIVVWRVAMLRAYKKLERVHNKSI